MTARHDGEILWSHRPREADMAHRWEVFRARPKGTSDLYIISHDMEGCDTHYYAGRTQPCSGDQCEACADNRAPQWKGYLCAIQLPTERRVILEITAPQAGVLDQQFRAHRTLRGTVIRISRPSGTANGRVRIEILKHFDNTETVQKAPQLKPMLLKMWRLKEDSIQLNFKQSPSTMRIADAPTQPVEKPTEATHVIEGGVVPSRRRRRHDDVHNTPPQDRDISAGSSSEPAVA